MKHLAPPWIGSLAAIALAAVLAGCATPRRSEAPQLPAAHDALHAVAWMRTSHEYAWACRQTFRAATTQIDAALADPQWDALPPNERQGSVAALPPAVIVDVDETVLDNGAFQARLVRQGRGFDARLWDAWVAEARAPALPGAKAFLDALSARGVRVFYVTNRGAALRDATIMNLRKVGFPDVGRETVLTRGHRVPGCDEGSAKFCRRRWIGHGHRVLMLVGDQVSDFVHAPAGQGVDDFADWLGQRWFVIPNPAYGGWESDLFGNDWSLDEETRRKRKLDSIVD